MRMTARFPGTCGECRKRFAAGDPIDFDRTTKRATCADCMPPATMAPAPASVVRVSVSGASIAFAVSGRLADAQFSAYRAATTGATYRDGVNRLSPVRAAHAILAIRAAGITLEIADGVQRAINDAEHSASEAVKGAVERTDALDAILRRSGGALYPYQRDGVAWLAPRRGALIADDMGLGKTIQALTALPADAACVVVCPAVAKSVWQREAAKWRPDLRVTVLSGRGSFRRPSAGEIVCINYDILSDEIPTLLSETVVILDEAHAAANPKAARTKRVRALCSAARASGGASWALTATPLKNKPQELWAVLETVGCGSEAFGSWPGFVRAFHGRPGRWGGYEWGSPSADVPAMLQRVSLRRRKGDVLADLPAKTHRSLPAAIDRATAKLCDDAIAEIASKGAQLSLGIEDAIAKLEASDLSFEKLSAARAALARAKIPAMLEVVETYEEQGEPLVVFSAYRAPIDLLATREGWATITGETSNERRGEIVEAFQAGKLRGVACTIRAGGVAITLTRASNVLRVDREWNPALNIQAEDRCYRIGQKSAVLVTDLVAEHRLDEMIAATLAKKEALIGASVEASSVVNAAPRNAAPAIDWTAIEEDAAKAARDAQEAAKAASEARDANARRLAEQRAQNARQEAQRRVRSAAARRLSEDESAEDAARRGPASDIETWAIEGLRRLAEADPDRARELNGEGFSKSDGGLGHALAWLPDLTDQEWRLAVSLARHYRRQIGEEPRIAA